VLGAALWQLVAQARAQDVDPEAALRAVARQLHADLTAAEQEPGATT
jgi:hypothetical protein